MPPALPSEKRSAPSIKLPQLALSQPHTGDQWQHSDFAGGGGTSIAGLRSKNPSGRNWNPSIATGITGQSSGRGTWLCPNTYHSAISVSSTFRFALVQFGRPSPVGC